MAYYETLRGLLEGTQQRVGQVATRAGLSRATVSVNKRQIQDGVTVRALRKIAAAAGAKLVIGFEYPDPPGTHRFCECCGAKIKDKAK